MLLAVIVLLRNEADIFPALARHLAPLFDIALFLDHASTDGTAGQVAQACAGRPGWAHWTVTVPGTHQTRFTTFALHHLFATTRADAVFLIDADEFIEAAGAAALRDALAEVRDPRCVPILTWRNAVPADLTLRTLRADDILLAAPAPSLFEKVVVPRRLFDATSGRLLPLAGNHVIDPGDGEKLTKHTRGSLLHVPLRSVEQMRRKIVTHALAHLARTDRAPHESAHVFEALARIATSAVGEDDLFGWAASYGEAGASGRKASAAALRRAGFTERRLSGAPAAPTPTLAPDASPWATIAAMLLDWRTADAHSLELVLSGTRLGAAPRPERAREDPLRAELDAALAALAAMRASRSWRITAPLRALTGRRQGALPLDPIKGKPLKSIPR